MKVSTLFPSAKEDEETRGGLVLLHLKKLPDSNTNSLKLHIDYEDRRGKRNSHSESFEFPDTQQEHYDNKGIRKGIVLSRYVTLMKNWMLYERTKEQSSASSVFEKYRREGIPPFPDVDFQPGQWERQSQDISVSEEYKNLFNQFIPYFEKEIKSIGDLSLEKERDILNRLVHSN